MYLVIKASGVFGIFSSKEHMRAAIEYSIKDSYENNGVHGNYHFRYIEFKPNEPWYNVKNPSKDDVGKALFSLNTFHDEYFTHKIETDWSTGEITKI